MGKIKRQYLKENKLQAGNLFKMLQKISMEKKHTDNCSFMSWGYNPFITEKSPYHGAYLAVVESISKLIATGAKFEDVYLKLFISNKFTYSLFMLSLSFSSLAFTFSSSTSIFSLFPPSVWHHADDAGSRRS
mgnify:CR=1 FL=1